jgi:hypothetical protein
LVLLLPLELFVLLLELFAVLALLLLPASSPVPAGLELLLHATPNATLQATATRATPRPRILCLFPFMKDLLIRYV